MAKTVKTQIEKFRDLARETECNGDEDRFEQALKRVAKAPAPKSDKPVPAKRDR